MDSPANRWIINGSISFHRYIPPKWRKIHSIRLTAIDERARQMIYVCVCACIFTPQISLFSLSFSGSHVGLELGNHIDSNYAQWPAEWMGYRKSRVTNAKNGGRSAPACGREKCPENRISSLLIHTATRPTLGASTRRIHVPFWFIDYSFFPLHTRKYDLHSLNELLL